MDNTFGACGSWCRPIDFGADIILHSATKWMGGHGTTVGGVIIDCGTFDWGEAGDRFPRMIKKDGPMSFSYWKAFGNIAFAMAMRIDILMEVGSILSPLSAQQLLIGMETLSLRCERHATNTMAVARFLESHPRIAWVNYPGRPLSLPLLVARRRHGTDKWALALWQASRKTSTTRTQRSTS